MADSEVIRTLAVISQILVYSTGAVLLLSNMLRSLTVATGLERSRVRKMMFILGSLSAFYALYFVLAAYHFARALVGAENDSFFDTVGAVAAVATALVFWAIFQVSVIVLGGPIEDEDVDAFAAQLMASMADNEESS